MTSINLLCQHIKFVIWYRLVFPIRCISRTPNYNKNMMFPLLSYTYENISFRSHHVHSFSHAFCSITFPAHHFPADGSRPVCHRFLRRADCRAFPAPSIRAYGFSACYRLWLDSGFRRWKLGTWISQSRADTGRQCLRRHFKKL